MIGNVKTDVRQPTEWKKKVARKSISVNGGAPFYINFPQIAKQVLFDMKVPQLAQNTG
jgi:hypothetical protein